MNRGLNPSSRKWFLYWVSLHPSVVVSFSISYPYVTGDERRQVTYCEIGGNSIDSNETSLVMSLPSRSTGSSYTSNFWPHRFPGFVQMFHSPSLFKVSVSIDWGIPSRRYDVLQVRWEVILVTFRSPLQSSEWKGVSRWHPLPITWGWGVFCCLHGLTGRLR